MGPPFKKFHKNAKELQLLRHHLQHFGLHSLHRREGGERKKENSSALFLNPPHICVCSI